MARSKVLIVVSLCYTLLLQLCAAFEYTPEYARSSILVDQVMLGGFPSSCNADVLLVRAKLLWKNTFYG